MRARAAAPIVALALACAAHPAAAAEPTQAEIAVARRLFEDAGRDQKAGRWKDAIAKLEQAVAIKDTPGLRYHLGYSREQSGQLVEALNEYDRADEALRGGVRAPDVEKLLGPKREGLKRRIPTLTVQVVGDPKDASLSIDGRVVNAALVGQSVPLNPGAHELVVSAPGRKPAKVAIQLSEREVMHKAVELAPDPAATSTATPTATATAAPTGTPTSTPTSTATPAARRDDEPRGGGSARTIVLVAESVVTAAALGVGLGYTLAKNSARSREADARTAIETAAGQGTGSCASPTSAVAAACRDLDAARSDADRAGKTATLGFVGAGVGAAALVATWILWPSDGGAVRARIAPLPVAGGVGIGAAGRF